MIQIKLSPSGCAIAKYIGELRNKYSMATKQNMRMDPEQTDDNMHIEAFGAELATAKYINVYPDIVVTKGELPNYDLKFGDRLLQVKRRDRTNRDLLIPHLKEELTYVLVYGSRPEYLLVGFMEGCFVRKIGSWIDLPYGSCWMVEAQKLHPIEDLFCQLSLFV